MLLLNYFYDNSTKYTQIIDDENDDIIINLEFLILSTSRGVLLPFLIRTIIWTILLKGQLYGQFFYMNF